MADTVDVQYIHSGPRKIVVKFSGYSDGTGEVDAIKVDKSTLVGPNGAEPSKLVVEEIEWNLRGYNYLILEWDRTSDQEIAVLASGGYKDYRAYGGLCDNASGGTGDIILTSSGAVAGSSYDISMVCRLKV
jgi:hypothetical protein